MDEARQHGQLPDGPALGDAPHRTRPKRGV
jgi:hypothetical protein